MNHPSSPAEQRSEPSPRNQEILTNQLNLWMLRHLAAWELERPDPEAHDPYKEPFINHGLVNLTAKRAIYLANAVVQAGDWDTPEEDALAWKKPFGESFKLVSRLYPGHANQMNLIELADDEVSWQRLEYDLMLREAMKEFGDTTVQPFHPSHAEEVVKNRRGFDGDPEMIAKLDAHLASRAPELYAELLAKTEETS